MSRLNSTLIALVLGAAAAAGVFAAAQTVRLGQSASASQAVPVAAPEIAARTAKLTHWSRSLARARAKHPPALPKIPKFAPVPVPAASPSAPVRTSIAASSAPPVKAPPVKYVRPAPVVEYQQTTQPATTTSPQASSSDDESEPEGSGNGGGDD